MTTLAGAPGASGARAWRRLMRQTRAVARAEMGHALLGRGAIPLWLLAAAPLTVFVLWAIAGTDGARLRATGEQHVVFAALYHMFILRVVVFFGAVVAFSNLFRREILGQTLHYYLLTPVPRTVLVVGKYLAALVATWAVFVTVTVVSFMLYYVPIGYDLVTPGVIIDGLSYAAFTALACLGWGAGFLALSLFVRNPIIPAVVVFVFEQSSFVLPAALQKLSILRYVQSMSLVPIPDGGTIAIAVEPTPAWIAVPGLLLVAGLFLVVAAWRVQRLEVDYGVE